MGYAIRYIRIFGNDLFVSWEDGCLGIYAIQNLVAYLDKARNNENQMKSLGNEVITIRLDKLIVLEERLSSFIKYSLPTYNTTSGTVRGTYFFRLDRNEIIRYEDGGSTVVHFRGISE